VELFELVMDVISLWMLFILYFMVAEAVRRNPLTCRARDVDVQQAVTKWLQFARDRDGGREARMKKQLQPLSS